MSQQPGRYYAPPPPPPPSTLSNRVTNWYKRQRLRAKVGFGCLAIFSVLLLCTCSLSAIGSALPPSKADQAAASTPKSQATVQPMGAQLKATPSPTRQVATPTPTPKPPTPTPTPKPPVPTPTPAPKPPAPVPTTAPPSPPSTGVNGNPWGYDFVPGSLIYAPPADFCGYFSCIGSFWSGRGYVMECNDGMYSKSGGIRGSCSYHGGNLRPLYAH